MFPELFGEQLQLAEASLAGKRAVDFYQASPIARDFRLCFYNTEFRKFLATDLSKLPTPTDSCLLLLSRLCEFDLLTPAPTLPTVLVAFDNLAKDPNSPLLTFIFVSWWSLQCPVMPDLFLELFSPDIARASPASELPRALSSPALSHHAQRPSAVVQQQPPVIQDTGIPSTLSSQLAHPSPGPSVLRAQQPQHPTFQAALEDSHRAPLPSRNPGFPVTSPHEDFESISSASYQLDSATLAEIKAMVLKDCLKEIEDKKPKGPERERSISKEKIARWKSQLDSNRNPSKLQTAMSSVVQIYEVAHMILPHLYADNPPPDTASFKYALDRHLVQLLQIDALPSTNLEQKSMQDSAWGILQSWCPEGSKKDVYSNTENFAHTNKTTFASKSNNLNKFNNHHHGKSRSRSPHGRYPDRRQSSQGRSRSPPSDRHLRSNTPPGGRPSQPSTHPSDRGPSHRGKHEGPRPSHH
jgi:hypothetical protein